MRNILNQPLQPCGRHTGYTRSGYCAHTKGDAGRHLICATAGTTDKSRQAWKAFLRHTDSTTNRSLSKHLRDTGAKSWCLCDRRYSDAVRAGAAPHINRAATNLEAINVLKQLSVAAHRLQGILAGGKRDTDIQCVIQKSSNPQKKFMVRVSTRSRSKTLHFGQRGAKDYTKHKKSVREQQKRRYVARHKSRENWSRSGVWTSGFWSRWLLWNKPSISESMRDIRHAFRLQVRYK